jgi:heat shock protein HtpX
MKNGLKTAVLLGVMAALIMFVGGLFGRAGLTLGAIMALVMVGSSYWFSDKLAVKMARAVEVSEHQVPQYYAIMRELVGLAEMPLPKLYVSPEQQPNAFATGRNPNHAAVCVTEGLLRTLNWDEIRGVLAHELMHVRNRDILTSSIAAGLATMISYAANIAMWSTMFGGGRDRRDGGNPFAGLVAILVAPLAAGMIQMGISRSREFEADRSAARLLGDGEPLARALEKLHGYAQRVPSSIPEAQASMYIVNPLAGRRGTNMANLFSTHPEAAERIRRLRTGEWRKALI